MNFIHTYNKNPLVLVTAKHSSGGGNALPECNGIVSWIEVKKFYFEHKNVTQERNKLHEGNLEIQVRAPSVVGKEITDPLKKLNRRKK